MPDNATALRASDLRNTASTISRAEDQRSSSATAPHHTGHTHTTFALPASHTTLDQLGSHDGDAGGSTFTTHPVAAPAAHDGPFVDQYKSASTSFGVLKRCPVLVLYRSRIHAHAVSRRRHAQTLQYAS